MDCTFLFSLQLSQFLFWHNSPYFSIVVWTLCLHEFDTDKPMVTSAIDKHFGLVDTGQRGLDGNKTEGREHKSPQGHHLQLPWYFFL